MFRWMAMAGLVCGVGFGVLPANSQTAKIVVDAAKAGPKLNPRMYGIFLEEINHGVDGGLYGERVANRAFEDSRPPEGFTLQEGRWKSKQGWDSGFEVKPGEIPRWTPVREGEAKGGITLETSGGLNADTPYCLRLDAEKVSGGRVGVANTGFWGIGVRKGETYSLALFARAAAFHGPLTVRLEDAQGHPCSNAIPLQGFGADWKRYTGVLKATVTEPKARLTLTLGAAGRVWLDFVSLFPAKTFKGRANGLRADIAQMIADLKPGFVRFPGGCVVEGGNLETSYDWKLTVGPVEKRAERWNAWNYRRTHGLGLLEYLQFCEDLHADPMWVGFAGQTCLYRQADHTPLDSMGPVAQSFLDIMEYASGSADSEWGRLRAQGGHPAPFWIPLVEIGNENGMREYEDRYRLIYPRLKAAYPELTAIADYAIPNASYDLIDEHYYNTPQWFLTQFGRYDRYNRRSQPVYVGEIAVTSDEGGPDKGNLLAALAEGVFLMGAERNADVVRMVSYAPLLAHVEGRSGWHGMIYFDSSQVYGTVSYHLWKLFGQNRPDHTVQTEVRYTPVARPPIAGSIGVGTWETSAEFRDIRVEQGGKTVYASDFAKEAGGWKTDGGNWSVVEGAYRQGENKIGLTFTGDPNWTDYTLSLRARKLSGAEGFLIAFGRKDGETYWWNIGGWGNRENGIEFNRTPVGPRVPGHIETGRWYDIRVELHGRQIRCYLDGKLIHNETAQDAQGFFASSGRDATDGSLLIRAINTSAAPIETDVELQGVRNVAKEARVITLKADDLKANNTLQVPQRVMPVESRVSVSGPRFRYTFPPYSLTILRLKAP